MKENLDKQFRETLKENEALKIKSSDFCFETIRLKQQGKNDEEKQDLKQMQINNQNNFYEFIFLEECQVNIFALKKFIKDNIKSLRIIEIKECSFYLSDEDVQEQKKKIKNQRMLQELKFDWLIEQFKFKNIQTISIILQKEQNKFKKQPQNLLKQTPETDDQKQKEDDNKLSYEQKKIKFNEEFRGRNLEKYVQDMIWGDIQDKEKFIDKLNENTLLNIDINLEQYKKYTKYALNDNKLIIIGDVLYNSIALKQLYNLIQLKCEKIQGIIFKDNGKIPPKVFSDLMKQIFLVPKLKQISFISSVLDEDSLYELQFLIQKKSVQFLILYRSYFLSNEIDKLLNMKNSKVKLQINHLRFVIIDISQKKAYEFTPYSNFNDLKQKKKEDMIQIERLYMQQKKYPQQIQNWIMFYQGKNLSIVNKNASEKILLKNWDFLNYPKEKQKLKFQQKQDNLIQILEEQFKEDDINILNYNLIRTLIKNVTDKTTKLQFEDILKKSKSYKFLKEIYPIQELENITFEKKSYLYACYSYLYGFTTIKEIDIYNIQNISKLYQDIRKNDKKYLPEFLGREICIRIFTGSQTYKNQIEPIKELEQVINFEELLDLQIQKNRYTWKSFFLLNEIFKKCKKLKKLSLSDNVLTEQNLHKVDFSLVSDELEEFDIKNTIIYDLSILNGLFKKALKLKKLNIQNVSLTPQKIKNIEFSSLSITLEELYISKNQIKNIEFLNDIFKKIPKLRKIDMAECSLNTELIKEIQFPPDLKEIILDNNTNINLIDLILKIGKTEEMRLEYFSALNIGEEEQNIANDFKENKEKLQAFSELKKLQIGDQYITDERYVQLILSNNKCVLTQLILKSKYLKNFEVSNIENEYQHLEILNLSGCQSFNNFKFLKRIFEKATKLKILDLSQCKITENKLRNGEDVWKKIPDTLQELYFSKNNEYYNLDKMLSKILPICKTLKVLHIEDCGLNDESMKVIDWINISTELIDLNIANNPEIKLFDFINIIFKRSTTLQRINLKNNKVGEELQKLEFNLLKNKNLEYIADEDEFYNEENQDYIIDKFEPYLQLQTFQQKYLNIQNDQNMNYFGIFEQYNLSQLSLNENKKTNEKKKVQKQEISEKIKIKSFQSQFFIMSPYFLFQYDKEDALQDEYQKRKDGKEQGIWYQLAFFEKEWLKQKKQIKYIFGYDKFSFLKYSDFYDQKIEFFGSGLEFIKDLNVVMQKNKIKKAFLSIRVDLSQQILKEKKLNEYQVLEYINSTPPAAISLKGMSIQFVKSWYVINFYAPLSVQTFIDVDYSLLENSSIANFLTIRSYYLYVQNFNGETFLQKIKLFIGKLSYSFFRLLGSQPKKFSFDHTVIHLENVIREYLENGMYNILRALFPIYISICVFGVYFFSLSLDITCGNGVSWYSYVTYAVFGVITFFIEAFIFKMCLNYVSHLIPELKPDCQQSFPYPFINTIKLFILDINWINQWYINYFVSFVLSQLSRFDFFTNITFLFTTYSCGDMLVFTLALISLSITTFICLVFYIINLIYGDSTLVTGKIDKLYEICNLLEFQAVADILDIISPSNTVIIFGKMFNQRIVNNFIRILLQDIPYLIIQVMYLLRKGVFNQTVIFSLVSSSIMFLVSLYKFLTITPSRLGQEDFNQINKIKKQKILPEYLKQLESYESKIVELDNYRKLKCILDQTYYYQILDKVEIGEKKFEDKNQDKTEDEMKDEKNDKNDNKTEEKKEDKNQGQNKDKSEDQTQNKKEDKTEDIKEDKNQDENKDKIEDQTQNENKNKNEDENKDKNEGQKEDEKEEQNKLLKEQRKIELLSFAKQLRQNNNILALIRTEFGDLKYNDDQNLLKKINEYELNKEKNKQRNGQNKLKKQETFFENKTRQNYK